MQSIKPFLARALAWSYPHVMCLVQGLLILRCRWRARSEPLYGHLVWERLGFYRRVQPLLLPDPAGRRNEGVIARPGPSASPCIWIHAVSMGETLAASRLLGPLRAAWPQARFILTHSTATGWATGQGLLQAGDQQTWLPWDCPQIVDRFLQAFSPQIAILMETEVWPVLVQRCTAHRIPVVLANARLSVRSAKGFGQLPQFFQPLFAQLSLVLAQTEADAVRLKGLACNSVVVCGNLKDDARPQADQVLTAQQWRQSLTQPVVLFASSHEGEERQLLTLLAALPQSPSIQVLIVPRHPNRFAAVARLCQTLGFATALRSSWTSAGPGLVAHTPSQPSQPCIWIGDSIGEMALYYSLADAVLLGGSFIAHGGQNLLEALACECPVWAGPHTWNFSATVAEGLAVGVVFPVAEMEQAWQELQGMLIDTQRRDQLKAACRAFMAKRGGVGLRMVSALHPYLSEICENP